MSYRNRQSKAVWLQEHTSPDQEVSQEQKARIKDLKTQIQALYEQLYTKDEQINQLNEVIQKQAVHIQSLIQENSKLNTKLLPEITENNRS